ncbi:acid phosphatase 1-like [Momordica charantia]|uniref:Acid phosphatase 1-like n=1 Tax=Momordica charantia TaxID=3673 RepID=A0A6J1DKC3_MOMCH|nr:acid phosphatase 1-like [Momordica charantia]
MASLKSFLALLLLLLLAFASDSASSRPIIRMFPRKNLLRFNDDTNLLCEGWKYSFEVNNLITNFTSPKECVPFLKHYFDYIDNGGRYSVDLYYAIEYAYEYAETVKLSSDGRDAWIFGVDDTLLSTLPYYQERGYGSETFNETDFNEWMAKADAPPVEFTWALYRILQDLGFKIIILTGRDEFTRGFTQQNLLKAGYSNWEKLIMRGISDQGKDAIVYKSEMRAKLVGEGYRLHGNTGDQWSDVLGLTPAARSFKFPNPMYYVP